MFDKTFNWSLSNDFKLEREIDLYMSEPFKKIESCEYWKQNKTTYP